MSQVSRKSYDAEFIERAVKLAVESGSPGQVAKDLGVNRRTMYGWIQRYHQGGSQSRQVNDEHVFEELKRLRKENARLKEERDILKNRFTRRAGACLDRNTRQRDTVMDARTAAVCFLVTQLIPTKNVAQGEQRT